MDTKTIKRMSKGFYEAWNQVEHITKFAKRLDDEMIYLNSHDGIDITEANKLQFYTEQMLDSGFFDKSVLIKWGKRLPTRKTWVKAKTYFEKWTKREEVYGLSVGGTAKKARFESNLQIREQLELEERKDNNSTTLITIGARRIQKTSKG